MLYNCRYRYCEEKDKLVVADEAVECMACEENKAMHKACFEKHNRRKHNGTAKCTAHPPTPPFQEH